MIAVAGNDGVFQLAMSMNQGQKSFMLGMMFIGFRSTGKKPALISSRTVS